VVAASKTTTTTLFGVGPVVAATVVGITGDVTRFASRDCFAAFNGTAPIEVSSGGRKTYRLSRRGNCRLNHAIHMAAVTQIRHRHSAGRAFYDRKIAEGKTPRRPCEPSSDASATRCTSGCSTTPARPPPPRLRRAREGNRGTTLSPARPAHTPTHRLFGPATPGPAPRLRPLAGPHGATPHGRHRRRPEKPLDKQRGLLNPSALTRPAASAALGGRAISTSCEGAAPVAPGSSVDPSNAVDRLRARGGALPCMSPRRRDGAEADRLLDCRDRDTNRRPGLARRRGLRRTRSPDCVTDRAAVAGAPVLVGRWLGGSGPSWNPHARQQHPRQGPDGALPSRIGRQIRRVQRERWQRHVSSP
jgi:hypothetical protein